MPDLRTRIAAVLTAHQRQSAQHCLCGWDKLGHSHPEHQADAVIRELAIWDKDFNEIPQHVTARINDGWYLCETCGATGSERWANLHQFPFTNTATMEQLDD